MISKHEIAIRVDERRRAVDIAYAFRKDHLEAFESKKKAGNDLAFIENSIAEECRYMFNFKCVS